MAHLTIHERRILHDIEQELAGDSDFAARFTEERRIRPVVFFVLGLLTGGGLAALWLSAGPAMCAFLVLVAVVCAASVWAPRRRRRTHRAAATAAGRYRSARKPSPRGWLMCQAQYLLTRTRA
ncbi:MAG TPA: DUF3040 domain-containing protein [Streptomyces sp.]|jgi:hypothetical protein|nr:DUF3040 domain-containing protein [Streptomyces sp.]